MLQSGLNLVGVGTIGELNGARPAAHPAFLPTVLFIINLLRPFAFAFDNKLAATNLHVEVLAADAWHGHEELELSIGFVDIATGQWLPTGGKVLADDVQRPVHQAAHLPL